MVETIKQGTIVDTHPHKERLDFLVFVQNIGRVDYGLLQRKTNWLVVRYAVAQRVNFVEFVENV
jgi:hypothetical protein